MTHRVTTKAPAKGVTFEISTLKWVAVGFVLFKVVLIFAVRPVGDEAYYWMWGQNIGLSYFDHPPLNGWLQGLMGTFLPWNQFGVRFAAILTFIGTVMVFRLWVRRLAPDNFEQVFWQLLVVYLASSPILIFTTLTFSDHLLVFLIALSAHFFARYLGGADEPDGPPVSSLYLGAVVLGLAGLAKYNAALFGIAIVVVILTFRPYRRLLRSPHLYLAGLVCFAILLPVLVWNLQNDFASFQYNLSDRYYGNWLTNPDWDDMAVTLALSAVTFAMFLLPAIWRTFTSGPTTGYSGALKRLGLSALVTSTLAVTLVTTAIGSVTPIYWNIIAFIVILVFAVLALRRRWVMWAHVIFGAMVTGLILINFAVLPVSSLVGQKPDWESRALYGWQQLADRVEALAAEQQPDFIAATRYTIAAQLGFAMGTTGVTSLSSRVDQYDFWFDPAARAGQRALVIVDNDAEPDFGPGYVEKRFETLQLVEKVVIRRFGLKMNTYDIYLGENFTEPASQAPGN
ncbi:MAG: glycosyltransferase family 39 protein [Alphaproteobacteria bacterium]|nr:glycosyltransferase family 39 protein [Alphaproteobacteria bacterium]